MFTRRGLNSGETEATSLLSREVKKTLAWRKKKKKETAKQEWRTVKEKEKRKFLLKRERGVINDLSAPLCVRSLNADGLNNTRKRGVVTGRVGVNRTSRGGEEIR